MSEPRILPPDEPPRRQHTDSADVRGTVLLVALGVALTLLAVQTALLIVLVVQGS